jgi:hypothetical protein
MSQAELAGRIDRNTSSILGLFTAGKRPIGAVAGGRHR